MPSFSERMGIVPPRPLQVRGLADETRIALWNVFYSNMRTAGGGTLILDARTDVIIARLWNYVLKQPLHTVPRTLADLQQILYEWFLTEQWARVMDLVEEFGAIEMPSVRTSFNDAFEREAVAYRFINKLLVPLTGETEIGEVEQVLASTATGLAGARAHIAAALKKLSERPTPDVRNSIKESISAVEAVARVIAGEGNTLGAAIKKLDADMDPALKIGLEKIYGWTNNDDGIRHAMMEEPRVAVEEARFMLVACSAFVNYLVVKADKKGIAL